MIIVIREQPMRTLLEVTTNPVTSGIFTEFTSPPWGNDITAGSLNLEYYYNHSGKKPISPLCTALLDENGKLTAESLASIADLVASKFFGPWEHLYATYSAEYNPLENYSLTERQNFENDEANVRQVALNHGKVETTAHGKVITTQNDATRTEEASRYGFDSSDGVPSDTYETTDDNDSVVTNSGSDVVTNSGSDNASDSNSNHAEGEKTITREGSSGNFTRQQLISEDRKLWLDNFFEQVYRDIDTILTLPIYPSRRRLQRWVGNIGYPNR